MKLLPDEIHFDCPKCKRPLTGDKALLGEMIHCPDCNEPFIPTPRKPAPPSRAEKIHYQADGFTAFAAVFFVIGLFIGVASLAQAISGEEGAGKLFIVAASLIGASLWFYLIAQIIHIRANLEK